MRTLRRHYDDITTTRRIHYGDGEIDCAGSGGNGGGAGDGADDGLEGDGDGDGYGDGDGDGHGDGDGDGDGETDGRMVQVWIEASFRMCLQ